MYCSPLRYPGGKGKLALLMETIITDLGHKGGVYIEPFAGGAGIAIELLEKGIVSDIVINDLDKGIYSFWRAILQETNRFLKCIDDIPLTMEEWKKQREICLHNDHKYSFELGFATFYMNRTNRSGIVKGGVIGGQNQDGVWKLDSRFNKETLKKRIIEIARRKKHIHVYNKEVESFLSRYVPKYGSNVFIYFDPPYYEKGNQLYLNFFSLQDHVRIEKLISQSIECDWVITYDDVPQIAEIYKDHVLRRYDLTYSAAQKRRASEIIVFKSEEMIPPQSVLEEKNICVNLR